ncbi:MAG: hypothetical protein KKE89_09940, partial [Actinobacteria bacterium]|nr:hypothetical protein [Actinomycetota bacterium]
SMDLSTSYGDDNLARYRDALETRTGSLAAVEQTTARFSALVRYRTILRRPSALFGTEAATIEDDFATATAVLGPGGERLDFTIDLAPDRATQVQTRLRNYHIDETDLQALYRTTESLRSQGVTVVLAELPAPDRYVALHPEGALDMARAHEAIRAIAEILEIPVIDLRYGYTDDDFVDYTHLDQAAAADLTTRLTTALTTTPPPAGPGETTTTSTPAAGPPLDTARRAYRTIESLHHPLTGGGELLRVPDHWFRRFGYVHEWNAAWHRQLGNEFDVVFLGSSMMLYAGDPRVFTELDAAGRNAYNASVPGSYPEDQRMWVEEFVLPSFSPSLVVWGLATRDIQAFDDGEGGCLFPTTVWDKMVRVREKAFAPIDALDGVPWHDLYFAETLTDDADPLIRAEISTLGDRIDYGDGPVIEETPFPEASRALFRSASAALALQEDEEGPALEEMQVCQERYGPIADTIEWLVGQGVDVLVVGMPMDDRQAGRLPQGRAQQIEIHAEIGRVAVEAGAIGFIDLGEAFPDESFTDVGVHLSYPASRQFTEIVVEELRAIGR